MPLISGLSEMAIRNFVRLHESGNFAEKTPVSVLQELLSRHKKIPKYELIEVEGPLHAPTFYYKVSCEIAETPFTAKGAGSSKKKAKHSAARALIEQTETNCSMERDANGSFLEEEMTQVDQEPQEQAYDTLDAEQTNSTASSRIYNQQLETIQEEVECECWLQWGCHPAVLCSSWGVTETDAERDAVQNAIAFLKAMIEENDG